MDPDYFIVTYETGGRLSRWRWEIKRHSRPMGIKLGAGGYQTQMAAERAGKQALAELLQDMARERQDMGRERREQRK